jgi:hypothetical protein
MSRELTIRNRKIYRYRVQNKLPYAQIGKLIADEQPDKKPLDKAAVCRIVKRETEKIRRKTVDNSGLTNVDSAL